MLRDHLYAEAEAALFISLGGKARTHGLLFRSESD